MSTYLKEFIFTSSEYNTRTAVSVELSWARAAHYDELSEASESRKSWTDENVRCL